MKQKTCAIVFQLILAAVSVSMANNRHDSVSRSPQHPLLFINSQRIDQIKKESREIPWKQSAWLNLKKQADLILHERTDIPARGGNWEQYYINPQTGSTLVRGKQTGNWQWEHIDTLTKQVIKSDSSAIQKDLDGVVIALIHDAWAIGALQLGLVYHLSGDRKYAEKAKDILLSYAAIYRSLPERNKKGDTVKTFTGKGKIHVQNLNEAMWLIDIVQSADCIWDVLEQNEKDSLARNIFYPAVHVINEEKAGILNIQCWKNAATGMVGFLLNDKQLIAKAMTDTATGYFAQLRKGVTKEGIWIDRSPTYHFYALNALVLLAQAARNYGYPVNLITLKKMFTGPALMANAGLSIPHFNDSKTVYLSASVGYLYEWAFAEYKDERYAFIIDNPHRGEFRNIGPTYTGWALLFGSPVLPQNAKLPVTTKNFPVAGVCMLSKGAKKENLTCYIKYNLDTLGAHTHWDALDVVISKGGEYITVIPGAENYASPAHANWHKTSIAHNTFSINQGSQHKSTGKIVASGYGKIYDYVITETDDAYDSLRYIRTACLLSANIVLIADQIQLQKTPRPFDIAFHLAGDWKSFPDGIGWQPPALKGYSYMTGATISGPVNEAYLSTRLRSGRTVIQSSTSSVPMSVVKGYGIPWLRRPLPFSFYRLKTNNALFVACISTDGKKVKIEQELIKDTLNNIVPAAKAACFRVTLETGETWKITVNPDRISLPGKGDAAFTVE